MIMKRPEVLAPAGSYDIMVRAFQAGADAVYLGGTMYGARAYAANLTDEELIQAIEYAACHHKKVYLTVNTLLKDEEIDRLSVFLKAPYEAGLHGVIVQDLGAVALIHREYPLLPIHASTQMTITGPDPALYLKDQGVTRIVPARELSIDEISLLREESGMEVEVFVHGALCYCYSGQCLLSSMIGGRSGNRGTCAQPCRQRYTLAGKDKTGETLYYLSPKDLCGLESVPELIRCGVDSLKIEGRMKNAEYVISAVSAYRRAVDAYCDSKEYDLDKERDLLADVFNRGNFTGGYYHTYHGPSMMSMERNHHNGLRIGTITKIIGGTIEVELEQALHAGDIIELRPMLSEIIELTSGKNGKKGERVILNAKQIRKLSTGMIVYRTKNAALSQELLRQNDQYQLKENIHISVICKKDFPATIIMSCDDIEITMEGAVVSTAVNQPVTKEDLEGKLNKIGDYPFIIQSISWEVDPDIFLSMKEFNRLRREAMEALYQACCHRDQRITSSILSETMDDDDPEDIKSEKQNIRGEYILSDEETIYEQEPKGQGLSVYLSGREQLAAVLGNERVDSIGLEMEYLSVSDLNKLLEEIHTNGTRTAKNQSVILALPHIYRRKMKEELMHAVTLPFDGYLVRTIDELCMLHELMQSGEISGRIILDSSVYTYNREAVQYMKETYSPYRLTLPAEYDRNDLKELIMVQPDQAWEWVIYGHQMAMVSAQCTYLNTDGCIHNQKNRDNGTILLKNSHDDELIVEAVCKYCYNVIYLRQPLCLFDKRKELAASKPVFLRMHFLHESPDDISKLIEYHLPEHYVTGRYLKGI